MALDESMFVRARSEDVTGTLRLYRSEKYAVSLGYFQNLGQLDLNYLSDNNIDFVRRITGGRAVLHGDDLIFSFAGDRRSPFFDESVTRITNKFASVIKRALNKAGIDTGLRKGTAGGRQVAESSFHCFGSVNKNEMLAGKKKIAGYALKRSQDSFLLQGSIPVDINERHLNGITMDKKDGIRSVITSINEHSKDRVDFIRVKEAFLDALLEDGHDIRNETLSVEESSAAGMLSLCRYKNPVWTHTPKSFRFEDEKSSAYSGSL